MPAQVQVAVPIPRIPCQIDMTSRPPTDPLPAPRQPPTLVVEVLTHHTRSPIGPTTLHRMLRPRLVRRQTGHMSADRLEGTEADSRAVREIKDLTHPILSPTGPTTRPRTLRRPLLQPQTDRTLGDQSVVVPATSRAHRPIKAPTHLTRHLTGQTTPRLMLLLPHLPLRPPPRTREPASTLRTRLLSPLRLLRKTLRIPTTMVQSPSPPTFQELIRLPHPQLPLPTVLRRRLRHPTPGAVRSQPAVAMILPRKRDHPLPLLRRLAPVLRTRRYLEVPTRMLDQPDQTAHLALRRLMTAPHLHDLSPCLSRLSPPRPRDLPSLPPAPT